MAPKKKPAKPRKKAPPLPINALESAFCHAIIQGKEPEAAAVGIGLAPSDGAAYIKRPRVQKYLTDYRSVFMQRMAEAEVVGLLRKNITRDVIAEGYLRLSMIPPDVTRGSITGQVSALDSLSALLNFKVNPDKLPEKLRGMSDDDLRQYLEQVKVGSPTPQ